MLQIISGKFFTSDERYSFNAYTHLFSNYSWVDDIELGFTKLYLDRAHLKNENYCYILNYINQIEKDENSAMVRGGDFEIMHQFQIICTFGFQAIFDSNESVIENLCKPEAPYGQSGIPLKFVNRYFDFKIHGTIKEIEQVQLLFNKIISLPREDYEIIIKCIEAFSNSLKILDYNFDLAYSMLIYCLETITQNFDGYSPSWEDYEKHKKMDNILKDLDEDIAINIRNLIIDERHFKLSQRFIKFIIKNTDETFFTIESQGVEGPLRRSEFETVLKNAYNMRSSYAHSLKPILEHIKNPQIAKNEIFKDSNAPYFTYKGLLRLTHHVMKNIILKKEGIEKEKIDWKYKIPGILLFDLDPKYWIANTKKFDEKTINNRFSAFLSQYYNGIIISKNATITDCSELMELYESKIPNAKKHNKQAMIIHYLSYNAIVPKDKKSKNYYKVAKKIEAEKILNDSCIENLIFCIITNQDFPGSLEKCEQNYEKYKKRKTEKNQLVLPQLTEILILLEIANKCIKDGYYEKYEFWINLAYLESTGLKVVQDKILYNWCKGCQLYSKSILSLFK